MEDEIDIYADLPNFDVGVNEDLAEKNKIITEKCSELEKQVVELTQSLESLKKINNNLEVNLSSLLHTAKAEVARKDRMIAEIRRELDNVRFRRGEHAKSSLETARRSPSRRRRRSPNERSRVREPQVPDRTEFVCGDTAQPIINEEENDDDEPECINGVVNTVYGERLRKKLMEEQEEDLKQQQLRASERIIDSNVSKKSIETDVQTRSKADDSLKLDSKLKLKTKGEHCDRKRPMEDNKDSTASRKKFKTNERESRYRDRSRSGVKYSESKSKDRNSAEMQVDARFHVVDEYSAPEGDHDDTEDRHNRVAIRLMLLAEGIDPDIEKVKPVENGDKKIFGDKRENGKRREARSTSRSRSRNRRHNQSRSRTPDRNHRSRRRSRQRDDRPRRSRDRFEKRRDSKNKDGDNLSEFSREIYDLREKIEHRIDDGTGNRSERGRGSDRVKRHEERIGKSGKSRTPDSSRSDSKERVHRSKADKRFGRSRSRERQGSRSRGHRYSKDDDILAKHSKAEIKRAEKTEDVQVLPPVVAAQETENPETKSLVSLEEGEIVDSGHSSPVKVVVDPVLSSIEKVVPPKFNLVDSDELVSEIIDVRPSLPLGEVENSQSDEKPEPVEEPALPIEPIEIEVAIDSLKSPKDERIENIAEFIANFATNTSEFKKDEQTSEKIIDKEMSHEIKFDAVHSEDDFQEEKIQSISNTKSAASSEDDPHELRPVENSHVLDKNPVTWNTADNDWCLIAIDSPIKNFEENRKNRMIAQSMAKKDEPDVPEISTTDVEPLLKQSDDTMAQSVEENEPEVCETVKTSDEPLLKKSIDTIATNTKEEIKPEMSETAQTDDEPFLKQSIDAIAESMKEGMKPEISDPAKTDDEPLLKQTIDTIAQSVQKEDETEVLETAKTADESLLQQLNDTIETPCADEKDKTEDLGVVKKVVSDKRKKPVIQSVKIISRSKPAVPKSLRSTYHRGRKEIVLSDTNSEECVKISMVSPTIRSLCHESEIIQECKEENKNPGRSEKVEKAGGSRIDCKKPSVEELFGDENDSKNVADDMETVIEIQLHVTRKKSVDETNKSSGKPKAKNSKTRNTKPELRNSTKESKITSEKATATKTSASKSSKTHETKSIGSMKNKTASKVDKTGSKVKSNVVKCLENGNKPAKATPKGSNSKQKKEPQKLIGVRRKRNAVNLEDNATSSSGVSPNSLSDKVDDLKKTAVHDLQLSNTVEDNNETVTDQSVSQSQSQSEH